MYLRVLSFQLFFCLLIVCLCFLFNDALDKVKMWNNLSSPFFSTFTVWLLEEFIIFIVLALFYKMLAFSFSRWVVGCLLLSHSAVCLLAHWYAISLVFIFIYFCRSLGKIKRTSVKQYLHSFLYLLSWWVSSLSELILLSIIFYFHFIRLLKLTLTFP